MPFKAHAAQAAMAFHGGTNAMNMKEEEEGTITIYTYTQTHNFIV